MIAKEGFPTLRRRTPSLRHVFCDAGLANIDVELKQLAVDPRRSPKRVRQAHLANELPNVRAGPWPAAVRLRFPTPVGSKPNTMPADHRFRLKDVERVQYLRSQAIEADEHQAINVVERRSFRKLAPQYIELVSKDEDLGFQRNPRPEKSDQCAPDQSANVSHRKQSINRFEDARQPSWVCGRDRASRPSGYDRRSRPAVVLRDFISPVEDRNVASKPRRLFGQSAIAMKIMAPKLKAKQR